MEDLGLERGVQMMRCSMRRLKQRGHQIRILGVEKSAVPHCNPASAAMDGAATCGGAPVKDEDAEARMWGGDSGDVGDVREARVADIAERQLRAEATAEAGSGGERFRCGREERKTS
jgi:hypothetical protein